MDKSIVGKALVNAKRLMNSAEFNNKVNGYVNEGAGADGYMPSSPRKQPQTVEEAYDPMDYTQMSGSINTKLPKNILESMLNNPINVTPANAGFGSVLGGIDTEELERSTPAQLPRRRLDEGTSVQQVPVMQPAGIDSNYLKFLVKEAVKKILREGAFDKYSTQDQMDAELDSNMNRLDDTGFAHAYAMGDPMVKNMRGSTMRDMMSDTMGNDIDPEGDTMDNVNW